MYRHTLPVLLMSWPLFSGCSDEPQTPAEHVQVVQNELNQGQWEAAESQAQSSLQSVQANEAISLQLHGQRMEAFARSGDGNSALEVLQLLQQANVDYIDHRDYLAVIYWIANSRECETSQLMVVLDHANVQYPDLKDTIFREAAEASAKLCAAASSDETEMLESLGYL